MWFYGTSIDHSINVSSFFLQKGNTTLQDYNDFFGMDPCPSKVKTLFLVLPEHLRYPIKIKENTPITIEPSVLHPLEELSPKIHALRVGIVYFVNTNINTPEITGFLIRSQFLELHSMNLYAKFSVLQYHITITVSPETEAFWKEWVDRELGFLPSKIVSFTTEDVHEYPGIHQLWKLGRNDKEYDYFLYFHSKGITRIRSFHRDCYEKECFDKIIRPVDLVFFVFLLFPSIHKIGLTCAEAGWMWHNVFWVSQQYVQRIVEPIKTSRRHYYEDWLARRCLCASEHSPENRNEFSFDHFQCSHHDCFNLLAPSPHNYHIGSFHHPDTAMVGPSNFFFVQNSSSSSSSRSPLTILCIHMAGTGCVYQVLSDMISQFRSYSFEKQVDLVWVGYLGPTNLFGELLSLLQQWVPENKIRIIAQDPDLTLYERKTLCTLHRLATSMQKDFRVFYCHTKGVTRNNHPGFAGWRQTMIQKLVGSWEVIQNVFLPVNSVRSVGIFKREFQGQWHYSGNFWWSTKQRIQSLPSHIGPGYLDAEMWIGKHHSSDEDMICFFDSPLVFRLHDTEWNTLLQ